MIRSVRTLLASFTAIVLLGLTTAAAESLPPQAAVASAHPLATEAGTRILREGGNAFDAAVAVAAALGVVEPYSSGFGGGGFFLLERAADGRQVMVDAREKAPAAATEDMYLDDSGEFVRGRALNGPLAAGIPGLVAGLAHVAEYYGRLPLARSLAPAIELAARGFAVGQRYQLMAGFRTGPLKEFGAAPIFLSNDEAPEAGATIVQTDLAATLRTLAEQGSAAFYQGDVALKMVEGVSAAGGIWTLADLADYRVVERAPIVALYRDLRIVTAPPPSSGGIVMAEALNILEPYDLAALNSSERRHVVIEAMRRGYRDRADYLGDPDFVEIPVQHLISKGYSRELADGLQLNRATPSSALPSIVPPEQRARGEDTTHLSVLDTSGNRVAATLSINYPFGACFVPPATGVLLNNEMDDFSARPLTPNAYGLVGNGANAIAPGKRPLSSMTPTFVDSPSRSAILGTPGGSRIISMVLLGVLEFAAGRGPDHWVSVPRFHHQYLPDEVQYERDGMNAAERKALEARGHVLKEVGRNYGNMQAIMWDRTENRVSAASDPRGEGEAAVFDVPTQR